MRRYINPTVIAILILHLTAGIALAGSGKRGLRFTDNGDGTLTDTQSGLMWTRKDSWADLGKCLNWKDAQTYIKGLKTGGHSDWRLPTLEELAGWPKGIVERSKTQPIGADYKNWKKEYTLHLDPVFGPEAAYWLWSSETDGEKRAGFVDLRTGDRISLERTACFVLGARAVRKP